MLATPHMRAIVEAYPEAEVTLLTSPACAVLVQGLPGLEVVAFERRGFAEMWRVLAWLRRRRFAVVFDLQGSLRSRLMTRCSGARQRIGCRPGFAYTQAPMAGDETIHAFDALNRLLAVAGIDPAPPQAWLPARDAVEAKVTDWLDIMDWHGSGGYCCMPAPANAGLPSAGRRRISRHWRWRSRSGDTP